jgi:hypothetical protein
MTSYSAKRVDQRRGTVLVRLLFVTIDEGVAVNISNLVGGCLVNPSITRLI